MSTTTNTNITTVITLEQHINQLARRASAGTLKRIYTTSADDTIRKLQSSLQNDFNIIDNNLSNQTLSDAYDIYNTAYQYLHEQIIINNLNANDTITITLKNGNEKARTIYQWACVAVRKYIYLQATPEQYTSTKTVTKADGTKVKYKTQGYTYIEDLNKNTDETATDALDREYIRIGKYNDIDTYQDYITYTDMITTLNLTDRQLSIVKMRMRGLSVTAIADKLQVSKAAISKQLAVIQARISELYPNMIRAFNMNKWNK